MTAVERVVEYDSVDPEDELEATGDRKPPPDWPQQGAIIFDKLSMRYFPDPASELVLKELDFDILPSEKVCVEYFLHHFLRILHFFFQNYIFQNLSDWHRWSNGSWKEFNYKRIVPFIV